MSMDRLSRLLVIEDELGITLALYKALSQDYAVDRAKSGLSGLDKARAKHYDAIVLDLGLPDISGLQVCRTLRDEGYEQPIIILTAEADLRLKVRLLDAGANDYVTKPFNVDELQARLRACLRTQHALYPARVHMQVGELRLEQASRSVVRADQSIMLRRKEYAILEHLMHNAGAAVTRSSLINHAWDYGEAGWSNTIDVHIKHLRDKLDKPFDRPLIKTVHGIGYKLDIPKQSIGRPQ